MNEKKVVIIGAGPAGLSAALWLKNLGFTPVVIEAKAITGGMQNFNFLNNDWVLGQPDVTGVDIAKNFDAHIAKEAIDLHVNDTVIQVMRDEKGIHVLLASQLSFLVCAVIVATGTRYRGKEILPPQHCVHCDHYIVEGPHAFLGIDTILQKKIAIIGAGDNAFENALFLLGQQCEVTLIARSSPTAQQRFLEQVLDHPNFTLLTHTAIAQMVEKDGALVLSVVGDNTCQLMVDRLHVLAGYKANTDALPMFTSFGVEEVLLCDENNFLMVNDTGQTNIRDVYAVGDVCNTQFPCVVSAIASGALAAKTISQCVVS
jgi:thioredoxin reductase